jgi:hypothetical protein
VIAKVEKLSLRSLNPSLASGFDIDQFTLDEIDQLPLSTSLKEKLKVWASHGIKKKRKALTDRQLALNYENIQRAIRGFKKAQLKQLQSKKKLALAKKQKNKSFAQIETDQAKQELEKNKQALERAQKESSSHLKLNREELHALVKAVLQVEEPQAIQTSNQSSSSETQKSTQTESVKILKSFTALPPSVQTVVASFLYNRREVIEKNGTPEEKNFWNATVKQNDWNEVAKLLKKPRNEVDHVKIRRLAETDYLIQNLLQKQPFLTDLTEMATNSKSPTKNHDEGAKYWKTSLKLDLEKTVPTDCIQSFKFVPGKSF